MRSAFLPIQTEMDSDTQLCLLDTACNIYCAVQIPGVLDPVAVFPVAVDSGASMSDSAAKS